MYVQHICKLLPSNKFLSFKSALKNASNYHPYRYLSNLISDISFEQWNICAKILLIPRKLVPKRSFCQYVTKDPCISSFYAVKFYCKFERINIARWQH